MQKIKHIFDGEYGCETLQDGEKLKLLVTLVDAFNNEEYVSVEDEWLIKNNLDIGSIWPEDKTNER